MFPYNVFVKIFLTQIKAVDAETVQIVARLVHTFVTCDVVKRFDDFARCWHAVSDEFRLKKQSFVFFDEFFSHCVCGKRFDHVVNISDNYIRVFAGLLNFKSVEKLVLSVKIIRIVKE